jgi:wobble nucleotide-excising tRNase
MLIKARGGGPVLTQIRRIKNFGVFGDYSRSPDVPDLNRYNVIYGENGSGKTTLSRLLACLRRASTRITLT